MFKLAVCSNKFIGTRYVAWCTGVGHYLEGAHDGGAHHIVKFSSQADALPFISQQRDAGNSAKLVPA